MSFPRYPKYKPSGVEWLGEVPEGWEVRRLKSVVEEPLKYGANEAAELDDRNLPRFVRITDIDEAGGLRDETFKSLPVEVAKPFLLREGDVLLARSGATVGKSFIYSIQWGPACFAGYLIRARLRHSTCLARWLYYFCQTSGYWAYVVGSQIQATIQNVSAEKYANLYLTLPPLSEQTSIAEFLDRETGKIDELVAEQRRLMELLKEKRQAVISHAVTKGLNPNAPMKPSGIEWLGDVPEGWVCLQVGKVCRAVSDGPHFSPNYVETGVPFLSARNVKVDGWSLGDAKYVSESDCDIFDRRVIPEIGDVLYTKGGTTGIARVVDLDFRFQVWVHIAVLKIHPEKVDPYFLAFALNSAGCYEQSQLLTRGATNNDLGLTRMIKILFALPPLDEQRLIVQFLETELAKFDTLTAEAQRAIDLLQERRSALISAAVTGQIDVRKEVA